MKALFSMFWGTKDGVWSHKRVLAVFVVISFTILMVGGISFLTIKNGAFPDIPTQISMMYWSVISTVLGISTVGGFADKMADKKKE